MSIIACESLTKHYGSRAGVESLSLSIPEGALFGFLGPNGAGKTTTIRLLLGFLRSDAGRARIFGLDCWRQSHRIKKNVGYLPGDLRLYSWMTGHDSLHIFGNIRRMDLSCPGRKLAEEFGLDLAVRVKSMSRGMRQKLGLILTLAHDPRVLILDEPTTALDPLVQDTLYALLRKRAAAGRTIFFSSHTLSEVEQLCDRVAIIRESRLVADESLTALRARAERHVLIRWKNTAPPSGAPPSFLDIEDRTNGTWKATLRGPVEPLIQWCAHQPIDDLSIGQPDLASLFAQFYK